MTVKMPEPVAWITNESLYGLKAGRTNSKVAVPVHASRSYVAKTPLITTTQAQAYADAVRREALEEALAVVADEQKSLCDDDHELGWSDCADAIYKNIRALINPETHHE